MCEVGQVTPSTPALSQTLTRLVSTAHPRSLLMSGVSMVYASQGFIQDFLQGGASIWFNEKRGGEVSGET